MVWEAAAGRPWSEIADPESLPHPREIVEGMANDPLRDTLVELQANWTRVREIRSAVRGVLQLEVCVQLTDDIISARTWSGLVGEPKDSYKSTRAFLDGTRGWTDYRMSAIDAIAGMADLQHVPALEATERQTGSLEVLAAANERQYAAHALIRILLQQRVPGLTPFIQAVRSANKKQKISFEKANEIISNKIERETGFTIHPRLIQGDIIVKAYKKGGEAWRAYTSVETDLSRDEQIDTTHFLWKVVAGHAVRVTLEGAAADEVVPQVLSQSGAMTAYTRRVTADLPFQDYRGGSGDRCYSYEDWVREVGKNITRRAGRRGRCPVQHSFVQSPDEVPEGSLAERGVQACAALQAYAEDTYPVRLSFEKRPTPAELFIVQGILAWAKPGGFLDPDAGDLDMFVQHARGHVAR